MCIKGTVSGVNTTAPVAVVRAAGSFPVLCVICIGSHACVVQALLLLSSSPTCGTGNVCASLLVIVVMRLDTFCGDHAGDSSALLRDPTDPDDGMPSERAGSTAAAATLAASRARSAHQQAQVPSQQANAGKVNLTEVRLQLQRQLKQQVGGVVGGRGEQGGS